MSDASVADRQAIITVLNRYAEACDTKRWALFDDVFTPDAAGDFGPDFQVQGRRAIVEMVAFHLGGCGPTQHLLGNYVVDVDGDEARASCKIRAFHVGAGNDHDRSYEVFGEYHDRLVRAGGVWRISRRRMAVTIELGTHDILLPAPEAGAT
jgi:3-phenylpropionate/cinnamic acid dioxygenase small subunit